jgi:hypothetical protein
LGVDIDTRLRDKIVRTQAPTLGAGGLPSKYYHVMAGVFMGCLMKQKKCPDLVANGIDGYAVSSYRGARMLGMIKEPIGKYGTSLKPLKYYENLSGDLKTQNLLFKTAEARRVQHAAVLAVIYQPNYNEIAEHRNQFTDGAAKGLIELALASSDVCFPQEPASSCEQTKMKLRSWLVDFEWSAAQHRVGTSLGQQQCRPTTDTELEARACKFLKSNEHTQEIDSFSQ